MVSGKILFLAAVLLAEQAVPVGELRVTPCQFILGDNKMKIILKALGLLAILLVATIAYVEVSSLNQKQTHITNNSLVNQASPPQPTETSTPDPSPSPPPAPKPTLCISDVKLSDWTSDRPNSVVVIDSPVNNSVYTNSTLTLTIHAKAQSHIILIDVFMNTDWAGGTGLFNNINSGDVGAMEITIAATITGIPSGNHWITVIANDYCVPAGGSDSVNFTVDA